MEESINSANRGLCSNEGAASSEESGWTMYFEDFLASEKCKGDGLSSSAVCGSSMISDAASCAARRPSTRSKASGSLGEERLKKRKGRGALGEDPLEDTASSPVHRPKGGDLSHMVMNSKKKDDKRKYNSQEDVGSINDSSARSDVNVNGLGIIEREDECTVLKKTGLCLVPLSMLVDYLV